MFLSCFSLTEKRYDPSTEQNWTFYIQGCVMQSLSAEVLEKKTIECCQCILYFCYKWQRLIHFVKIRSSNFSGNEFLVKMYKLLKNSTFKINIISKTTISKEFNYFMQYELNTTGISKRDLDWPELFHQKRKQAISFSRTLFCYCHFDMDFIFSTYLFIYMNIFFLNLYYQTLKVRCLILKYCWIPGRMFISFSPCTWNLRSIESSDFEKKAWSFIRPNLNTLYYIKIWFWRRWNLKRLHTDDKTDGRTMDNRKQAQVISNTNWKLMKQHCFSSC